jgi:hypothetical protein
MSGVDKITSSSFKVGTTAGFAPNPAVDTNPRGTITFTGGNNLVRATVIAPNTVRYALTIPENVGPFKVGNVVLYVDNDDAVAVPFVMVSLPYALTKAAALSTVVPNNVNEPGARTVFNITLVHSETATIVSVQIDTPTYASIAQFSTTAAVPAGASLTWQQVVSQYDPRTKSPVFIAKDGGNVLWGMPYAQIISSPTFGHMDGGFDGAGYGADSGWDIINGGDYANLYLTPNAVYDPTVYGGGNYTDAIQPTDIIGGATY